MTDRFYLKYKSGNYVAIGQSSGGYPYPVSELERAQFWNDATEASKYARMFKDRLDPHVYRAALIDHGVFCDIVELWTGCNHHCITEDPKAFTSDALHYLDCQLLLSRVILNKGP